jgi:hypothetical protein
LPRSLTLVHPCRTNVRSTRPTSITRIQCSDIYITQPSGRLRKSCDLPVFAKGFSSGHLNRWCITWLSQITRMLNLYISYIGAGSNALITRLAQQSDFGLTRHLSYLRSPSLLFRVHFLETMWSPCYRRRSRDRGFHGVKDAITRGEDMRIIPFISRGVHTRSGRAYEPLVVSFPSPINISG